MLTLRQSLYAAREQRDDTPTPVWHLAKACGVDVQRMIYHLGKWNVDVFKVDGEATPCISKTDARRLMRFSTEKPL